LRCHGFRLDGQAPNRHVGRAVVCLRSGRLTVWPRLGLFLRCRPASAAYGRLPEWPKGAVCKTVGSAYVGSNPTPATRFRSSEPVTLDCVTGFVRAKGAVHQTVGCGLWAMRGPDPAVCSRRTLSHMMPSQLRKQSAGWAGAASVLACRAGVRGPWRGRRGRAAYIWRTGSRPVPTVRHTARCHACRRAARGPGAIVGTREVHLQCTRVYAESMTGIRPEAGDRCFRGSVKGALAASAGVIVT
jgi:hypothetical protein